MSCTPRSGAKPKGWSRPGSRKNSPKAITTALRSAFGTFDLAVQEIGQRHTLTVRRDRGHRIEREETVAQVIEPLLAGTGRQTRKTLRTRRQSGETELGRVGEVRVVMSEDVAAVDRPAIDRDPVVSIGLYPDLVMR